MENSEMRALDRDDLGELLALYKHLNPADPDIEEDQLKEIWTQSVRADIIKYVGLFVDNQLVSACQMVVVPNLTRGGLPYCLIENVVTHADHQNTGCGKALLRYAIEHAWKQRCYKVMLMSGRKQESVLQFYKSAGFSADEKTAFVVRSDRT